jgi:dihydrolipoamide dehydrogenase
MLNNSHIYHQTQHDLQKRGIDGASFPTKPTLCTHTHALPVTGVSLNLPQMLKAKDTSVTGLTKGIETLFKQNKVDYIKGAASFISPTRLSVSLLEGGSTEVEATNIIIATGSEVSPFPGGGIEIDEQQIVSSTGALSLTEVPKKMVVIGGGIIGLEMGSVWSRLGAEVTVVEFLGAIGGAGIDEEVAKQFQKILGKQGLKFKMNTKVVGAEKKDGLVLIKTEAAKGGKEETVCCILSQPFILLPNPSPPGCVIARSGRGPRSCRPPPIHRRSKPRSDRYRKRQQRPNRHRRQVQYLC